MACEIVASRRAAGNRWEHCVRTIGDGDGLAVRRKRNQAHSWLEESALPAELQPIARAQQWKMEQLDW